MGEAEWQPGSSALTRASVPLSRSGQPTMTIDQIKPNTVLRDPNFPESVQFIVTLPSGFFP